MPKRNYILNYIDQLKDDFFFWLAVSVTHEPVTASVASETSELDFLFEDEFTDSEPTSLSDADLDYLDDLYYHEDNSHNDYDHTHDHLDSDCY